MVVTPPDLLCAKQPTTSEEFPDSKTKNEMTDAETSVTVESALEKEHNDNDLALTDSDDGASSSANGHYKHETLSFDSFDNSSLHQAKIETTGNKWHNSDHINRDECDVKAKNIIELQEQIRPELVSLIKEHRLLRLVEGERFPEYTNKGHRNKYKYWFCRLSNNHKALHYGECRENETNPKVDELENKLLLSEVKRLILGRDCPHMKDNKSKRSTINLAFSLVYENDQEGILNFVAPDEKTYGYWIDGLRALMNQEMISEEFHKDLKMLSQIEVKMKSLNLEEIDMTR